MQRPCLSASIKPHANKTRFPRRYGIEVVGIAHVDNLFGLFASQSTNVVEDACVRLRTSTVGRHDDVFESFKNSGPLEFLHLLLALAVRDDAQTVPGQPFEAGLNLREERPSLFVGVDVERKAPIGFGIAQRWVDGLSNARPRLFLVRQVPHQITIKMASVSLGPQCHEQLVGQRGPYGFLETSRGTAIRGRMINQCVVEVEEDEHFVRLTST